MSGEQDGSFGYCRTPHGVRGLKLRLIELGRIILRRTPHGVRGLKPLM